MHKMPRGEKRRKFLEKINRSLSREIVPQMKERGIANGRRAFIDCFERRIDNLRFLAEEHNPGTKESREIERQKFDLESRFQTDTSIRRLDAMLDYWKKTLSPNERYHALSEFIRWTRKKKSALATQEKTKKKKSFAEELLAKSRASLLEEIQERAMRERRLKVLQKNRGAFLGQLERAVLYQPENKRQHTLKKRLMQASEDIAEHLMDRYFYYDKAKTFQAPDFHQQQEITVSETISIFDELWKYGKITGEKNKAEFKKEMRLSLTSSLRELTVELNKLTLSPDSDARTKIEKSVPKDIIHSANYHFEKRKAVLSTVLQSVKALRETIKTL